MEKESIVSIAFFSALAMASVSPGLARAQDEEVPVVSPPSQEQPLGAAVRVGAAEVTLPEITPGTPLTLAEALQAADRRNVTLAAARMEIDKAEAQLARAWALLFPVAQGNMQYIHLDHEDSFSFSDNMPAGLGFPDTGKTVIRPQDSLTGGLQVALPLVNLQNWYTITVARRGEELARLGVEGARQQLLLGVAQAYYLAMMNRSLIALHEEAVRSSTHHLYVARVRFEAGTGLRIDVIRAETDLEQARQQLLAAHLALDNTRDALGLLSGIGGLPMPAEGGTIAPPQGSETELVKRALGEREDIEAKRATVGLAQRQVDASWMQFLPTLDAAWMLNYQFTKPGDLGSPDRSRWTAILTLSVPIYNQFRYADLDAKRAFLQQSMIREEEARLGAAGEVRRARRDYLTALSSVEIAERQSRLTQEALGLVEAAYQAGTGTSLDVTDARRTASGADVNLAGQKLRAQIALLALLRAVGQDMEQLQ